MKHKKVFLFSGVLLIAVLLLSLFGVVKPQNTNRSTSVQDAQTAKSDVTIAVVNEDSGTNYNGDKVNHLQKQLRTKLKRCLVRQLRKG